MGETEFRLVVVVLMPVLVAEFGSKSRLEEEALDGKVEGKEDEADKREDEEDEADDDEDS